MKYDRLHVSILHDNPHIYVLVQAEPSIFSSPDNTPEGRQKGELCLLSGEKRQKNIL